MKTAMDAVDPQKIKQAQDFINEGKEHEYNLKLSKKVREITHLTGKKFEEVNQTFLNQYNELLNIAVGTMVNMEWEEREKLLKHYAKNADTLRSILEAWDNGEFDTSKP